MTESAPPDWALIEQLVRTSDRSISGIARDHAVPISTLRYRAARQGWRRDLTPPSMLRANLTAASARRSLVHRFYKAIDTKLRQMELRMQKDMDAETAGTSAADHERDTRALGGLINQLSKISEFEADLDRPTGPAADVYAADLAAEAERYRSELAERLARLLPPVA